MTSLPLAEAVGEEVAHRRFDRRPGIAVPEDPEHQLLVVGRALGGPVLGLRAEEGDPDVGDDARALSSIRTWVPPGGTLKLSQLLWMSASPWGSAVGSYLRGPVLRSPLGPRRSSPTRMAEVARMERPFWGLASPSRIPPPAGPGALSLRQPHDPSTTGQGHRRQDQSYYDGSWTSSLSLSAIIASHRRGRQGKSMTWSGAWPWRSAAGRSGWERG